MSILLEIRDYIQKFYQKYAAVLNVILRFLAAFITFFATNRVIGFNPYLDHTYTELVFAAVSVVFPAQILLFFEAVFITLHILYVSHYLAFVTAIFFAILYFVYVRFIPKDGYVILSMPVLSSFGAPYILPILLGIIADPIAIIPESIGVIVYHYLQNVISVVSTSTEDSINLYHLVLKQTFKDKELYIILIVFSIVTIFVYFIRNSKIDYSFEIAIISGGFLNTILLLFMNFFMDININVFRFFITMILSVVFVWLVQLFRLSLNYAGVENLQFEDDEYYYYVKAIPKVAVTTPEKTVKKINERQETEIIDAEAVKRLSQDVTEETKAISVEPSANHKLRKETSRKTPYNNSEYRSPAQIRASQAKKHSPKRGPMPKKHDMKDVDKLLLTQSLENEFHASGKKTANKRKR